MKIKIIERKRNQNIENFEQKVNEFLKSVNATSVKLYPGDCATPCFNDRVFIVYQEH